MMEVERRAAAGGRPPLEIHRSPRRRRTGSAHARDGVVVVRLPAGLAPAEDERMVERLVARVTGRARAQALGGDDALARRARLLADRYVEGVRPTSVRWSGRMVRRLGSCTPATGEIRISREVAAYPDWVRDYVIVHELAHLLVPDHSSAFHTLLDRYPWAERARGWLEGHAAGRLAAAAAPADEPGPPPDGWTPPADEPGPLAGEPAPPG